MDANTLSTKTIFGQERRYVVPLFQRPYVWTREGQWEALWEDVRSVADRALAGNSVRPHFLGAIVLDQLRKPTGHLETRLLVDGQQRLTTIQLLLEAFCDLCAEIGEDKHHRALLKLTRNDDPLSEDDDEEFKVWPTNVDREHFRRVMRVASPEQLRKEYQRTDAEHVGHPLADGYLFFHYSVREWLNPEADAFAARLEALYTTLREHIRVVVIDLDHADDAQLIFETLNARGTPLLPSDLVKNYLFHLAERDGQSTERLYSRYWEPFDQDAQYWRKKLGRGHAKRARIDIFLQHYLTLQTKDEVPVAHLYDAFRDHLVGKDAVDAEQALKSIREYADIYRRFDEMPEGSREALFFERLQSLDTTTAYPFLLGLFKRHGTDLSQMRQILDDLESFLVRRMVCGLNTRGYNRLFIELLGSLTSAEFDSPSKSVRGFLMSSDAESNRWPSDREFQHAWLDTPVYRTLVRRRVRMLLEGLERELWSAKTEDLKFGERLTIEHVLPQEWREHWPLSDDVDQVEAEAKRNHVLHTIGNLTLLTKRLNPSVSNGPWSQKKKAILEHSALSLNRPLNQFNDWDEAVIARRSAELLAAARRIWRYPV